MLGAAGVDRHCDGTAKERKKQRNKESKKERSNMK